MADFKQASAIAPNDSETLNNLGVLHWKLAQDQDVTAAKAELAGDLEMVKTCRRKSVALKDEATDFWNRGVAANPNSSDIHSNLGYAYSEANDLDKAEFHSRKAVKINNLSPRPHNNLGRVLLRQSYEREAAARETETKGETDPAVAAKVKRLREEAKAKLDEAIVEFKNAAQLDPALLEARLNLGGVYTQLNELDKADAEYRKILRFEELAKAQSIKDPDLNANFSRAYCGLAQTAIARKQTDEAIRNLQTALQWNPNDILTLRLLALQRYQHSEYRDGGKCLQSWLAKLPPATRQKAAEQFVKQLDDSEHHEAAAKARAAAKLPAEK